MVICHRILQIRFRKIQQQSNAWVQRRDLARPLERFVGRQYAYFPAFSTDTASNGDSKAMKRTHGTALAQKALCGRLAGPYA